jgi:hypothetical protein
LRQLYLLLAEWEQQQDREEWRAFKIVASMAGGEAADKMFPDLRRASDDAELDDASSFRQVAAVLGTHAGV